MALADYKIRIIANACITRYEKREGDIITIVDSYNLAVDDRQQVLAHIFAKRPDIEATAPEIGG